MIKKRKRYITSIFTLDKNIQTFGITGWDDAGITEFVNEQNKHHGLFLVNEHEAVSITIEYTNIIWVYRVYFGSCKKRYKNLDATDERWSYIEKYVIRDLKMMGAENITDELIVAFKKSGTYEIRLKFEQQFKNYCI